MQDSFHDYGADGFTGEAFVVRPGKAGSAPAVLVAHQWAGQSQAEHDAARWLAARGYVGIAIDAYGKGRRGEQGTPTAMEVNSALMTPLVQDRGELRRRLLAAVDFAEQLEGVDHDHIAIMGFCFGGLCALDVARSGTDKVRGAVSIHGLFTPPALGEQPPIKASVLICHGWEDPMAKPDDAVAVARELTEAGADWQMLAFGHAMHAFTAKGVNMPDAGLQYNEKAERRTWSAIERFLQEIFAEV